MPFLLKNNSDSLLLLNCVSERTAIYWFGCTNDVNTKLGEFYTVWVQLPMYRSVADPGFSRGGGAWTLEMVTFRKFCMSKRKNLDPWGRALGTPRRSGNVDCFKKKPSIKL